MLGIFIGMLFTGTVESLISYLMGLSRDYRYIAYILQEEKKIHKELFEENIDPEEHLSKKERHQQRAMIREKLHEKYGKGGFLKDEGIRRLHEYVEETEVKEESQAFECPKIEIEHCGDEDNSDSQKVDGKVLEELDSKAEEVRKIGSVVPPPSIVIEADDKEDPEIIHFSAASAPVEDEENKDPPSESGLETTSETKEEYPIQEAKEENIFVRLVIAIYYAILSRSELICYIMIILNHINSASMLSMPLPFLMLCWGTLNVPLPTKTFWITVISYTETMVVIKYIFQFGFFPWNHSAPSLDPFWPPRILGVEKRPTYAAWDLALLMTLFLHRNILMVRLVKLLLLLKFDKISTLVHRSLEKQHGYRT